MTSGDKLIVSKDIFMRRILKLMPDYECFLLWISDNNGLYNVNPDALDIPNELKTSLHSWSNSYDKTLNIEDQLCSSYSSQNQNKILN